MYNFPQVSLLITHYKRSKSLENLLKAFKDLNCEFGEIIVSDDCSPEPHLNYIKDVLLKIYNFKFISAPVNKGLGNNINKGQDAVTKPFTLYIQEDFEPQLQFPQVLQTALDIIKKDDFFDIIKFYAYFPYPYTKPYGYGFSETIFRYKLWYANHLKFYFYSDHPHLRHSNFFEKFGRYSENIHSDKTELLMSLSFILNNARGLIYDEFGSLFIQKNSLDEPSTIPRANWKQSKNTIILFIRYIYLRFKFAKWNWELLKRK